MTRSPAEQALAYLARHTVATIATQGPHGLWAAAVFYVNERFDLIFLSAGHTRHAGNLAAEPRAAATIQEQYRDWPSIQGIQLEGWTTQLEGTARDAAIAAYLEKYPFVGADARLQPALQRVNWYRLTAERVYFIDNTQGFGHRDQV